MQKKLSASSQQEKLVRLRREDIPFTEAMRKELAALKYRKVDLSDPDAPEITNWDSVVRGKFYRLRKKQVTIRFDMDVLEWFQRTSSKYQTLMNLACREYMMTHQKNKSRKQHARKKI